MRLVLIECADLARWGSARRLDFDDVGAHVGEHLAAQEAAFGGEIEDAIWRQHRHWILGGSFAYLATLGGFRQVRWICDGSAHPSPVRRYEYRRTTSPGVRLATSSPAAGEVSRDPDDQL